MCHIQAKLFNFQFRLLQAYQLQKLLIPHSQHNLEKRLEELLVWKGAMLVVAPITAVMHLVKCRPFPLLMELPLNHPVLLDQQLYHTEPQLEQVWDVANQVTKENKL